MISDKIHMKNVHLYGNSVLIDKKPSPMYAVISQEQYGLLKALKDGMSVHEYALELIDKECIDNSDENIGLIERSLQQVGDLLDKMEVNLEGKIIYSGESGVFFPKILNIEMTDSCNFRCIHCYKEAGNECKNFLSLAVLQDIEENFSGKIPLLHLTGGEPLLFPDIDVLLRRLVEKFVVNITTNGALLERLSDEVIRKVNNFQISIYGSNEIEYKNFTCKSNMFKKVFDNLRRLTDMNIGFSLGVIITESFVNNPTELLNLLKKYSVERIIFSTISNSGRGKEVTVLLDEKAKLRIIDSVNSVFPDRTNIESLFAGKNTEEDERECDAGGAQLTISEKGRLVYCNTLNHDFFDIGPYSELTNYVKTPKNHEDFLAKIRKYCSCSECKQNICPLVEVTYEKIYNK